MIFVPGAAFQQTRTAKLDSYLAVGDNIIVRIRSQAPRRGCNWIAEYASKITALNTAVSSALRVSGNDNCCANDIKRGILIHEFLHAYSVYH